MLWRTSPNTDRKALLSCSTGAGHIGSAKEGVCDTINLDITGPSESLNLALSTTSRDQRHLNLTEPVQNVGQTAFKAFPAPCGSHAERYGVLTASGIDAGLKGVADQAKALTVVVAAEARTNASQERRAMTEKLQW